MLMVMLSYVFFVACNTESLGVAYVFYKSKTVCSVTVSEASVDFQHEYQAVHSHIFSLTKSEVKDTQIDMAIYASFLNAGKPVQFVSFAFVYRIFSKLKAFEPRVSAIFIEKGEDEGRMMRMGKRSTSAEPVKAFRTPMQHNACRILVWEWSGLAFDEGDEAGKWPNVYRLCCPEEKKVWSPKAMWEKAYHNQRVPGHTTIEKLLGPVEPKLKVDKHFEN
ncbi:hypothetical protein Tco_0586724 [Tanacetum coccineum]